MKKLKYFIIPMAIAITSSVFAQNAFKASSVLTVEELEATEQAIDFYWNPKQKDDPKKAIDLLENIFRKDPKNWISSYWAAYISTQVFRSGSENAGYLSKAEESFRRSYEAYEKHGTDHRAIPYFHALQSLIYQFRAGQFANEKNPEGFNEYTTKSQYELDRGLDLNPDNPVLMVIAATKQVNPSKTDFSQIISTIALLEKSQKEFEKIESRSLADITYWNEHWIDFWLARTKSLLNMTMFKITSVPEDVKGFSWIELRKDSAHDGAVKGSADGKAFHYFYQKDREILWFRFDLYNEISEEFPSVSVSFDTDADQSNGINWYGKNKNFKFEKMVSVGPVRKDKDYFFGYNGITDEVGVKSGNFINVKKGSTQFFLDLESRSYFMSVKLSDIDSTLKIFNVIGSVGQNARWNDDIGEEGFSEIRLDR